MPDPQPDYFRGVNIRLTPVGGRPTHLPTRPAWSCGTCGQQWPCEPAKATLRADYDGFPTTLSVYLASQYSVAVTDLTYYGAVPMDLYARMVGWMRN